MTQPSSHMRARGRRLRLLSAGAALLLALGACTSAGEQEPAAEGDLGEIIPTMSIVYYATDHGPVYEQSARVLVDEFEQLGLDVELNPMQQSTMVDQIHVGGGLEDLAYGSWGGDPDRLDPSFWVYDLSACDATRNAVKWCDETYTEIAEEQRRTLDEEQRRELVFEAQAYFQEHAPWWQVSHETAGMLYNSDRWGNVTEPSPMPPHETVIHPWLQMTPTGDDRVIDWAYFEDLSTYNPIAEVVSVGWLRFVYDSFLRFDGSEVVPWAVESWEDIDDTTIELTLREGMTFHDGEPVTAEDAVFSINMGVEQQPPAMADALAGIEGAEQVDELTFRILMTEPNAGIYRQALTDLVILPEHIWGPLENPVEFDPVQENAVIGSGPFAFESWSPNQEHVLTTHTEHWAAPAYDGIRRLALGQADAVRAAMLDGTADIATSVVPSATMEEMAEAEDHLDFVTSQSFNTTTVWVNHEKAPFNDLEFRRALRLATNKERVALEGWLGFAIPGGPGNVPIALENWHNPDLEEIPYDMEQARQVLEDAGYGWDGEGRLHFPPEGG